MTKLFGPGGAENFMGALNVAQKSGISGERMALDVLYGGHGQADIALYGPRGRLAGDIMQRIAAQLEKMPEEMQLPAQARTPSRRRRAVRCFR
jgi:hypothetical protein